MTSASRSRMRSAARRARAGSSSCAIGHAERGHDGVADELLDRPALGLDLLAHRPEVRREHLLQPLGVQSLAQAGRARHVGEQDRHEAAFLTGRQGFDRFEHRAAGGQNRAPSGTSAPQAGHAGTSDDPHDEAEAGADRGSRPRMRRRSSRARVYDRVRTPRGGARAGWRHRASRRLPRMNVPEKPAIDGLEVPSGTSGGRPTAPTGSTVRSPRDVFAIDTPPPTASGSLHIGHVSRIHIPTSSPDSSACGARPSSTRWDGTTTVCPPSAASQNFFGVRCDPSLPYDPAFDLDALDRPEGSRSPSRARTSSSCANG